MKGLYLNVPSARQQIQELSDLLQVPPTLATATHQGHEITVNYHPGDWPAGPLFRDASAGLTAAASGWFVYRGKLGDLEGLARSFEQARSSAERQRVLADMDAGAFVILLLAADRATLITDPFGLHPHYYCTPDPFARIAPSPHFIRGEQPYDERWHAALQAQDHLFGNLTAYAGIQRLEPNAILTREECTRYFTYAPAGTPETEIPRVMHDALARFTGRRRILPISGGLDSRFLLACGEFDYGYTYGPRDTGDRPVARRFARKFTDYYEFSLLDHEYPQSLRAAATRIFDGVCARPFAELLPIYLALHRRWGPGCQFFDGYVGDVLQRATLLTSGGLRGSLAKLFPVLTLRRFDAVRLLRRRYAHIGRQAFANLVEIYREKTGAWDLDEPRKVLLFELIYGKGARHALNGGTILSGQYFATLQPFVLPPVFRAFWGISPHDALTYRAIRRIWRTLPREFADVPTYSGFKPIWNHDRARATMLVVKGLSKVSLCRRAIAYDRERSQVRWI